MEQENQLTEKQELVENFHRFTFFTGYKLVNDYPPNYFHNSLIIKLNTFLFLPKTALISSITTICTILEMASQVTQ